jgi:hypothetical protein
MNENPLPALNIYFGIVLYCDMMPESCNLPICWWGFAEHISVETWNTPLLDGKLLEHVTTATNMTE